MRHPRFQAAMLAVFVLAYPAAAQLRLVPFDVRVPSAPMPVPSGGKTYLVYELRITNLSPRDRAVKQLDVTASNGDRPLARWTGQQLRSAMLRIGPPEADADARVIPGGRQGLVYLWIGTEGRVPDSLHHQILVTAADSIDRGAVDTLAGPTVAVRARELPVLVAPFRGGLWLAANGPSNTSGHRRTAIPLDGLARVPQRFATDWLRYGPDGTLFQGDSTRNASWYGYGAELLAVGAGTVLATKDGIAENVPLSPVRAVPITLETVGGNHVIIDLGGGFYAFYAHLQPGSLRVKVGDRVTAGQVIGLLGNSGNSTAPHLHLHVGDRPSPLGTEGLPFRFESYRLVGQISGLSAGPAPEAWLAEGAGEVRQGELPLENQVVRFP